MYQHVEVGAIVIPYDDRAPDEMFDSTWEWGVVLAPMWSGWWQILTNNGKLIMEWHEYIEVKAA